MSGKSGLRPALVLAAALLLGACVSGVNGNVEVDPGAQAAEASTVNGSVRVGAGARVDEVSTVNGSVSLAEDAHAGEAVTVNGSITLAARASVGDATTVNGGIILGPDAKASGDITSVNGKLELAPGVIVAGHAVNVNGAIRVEDASIGKGLVTVAGDIDLRGTTVIRGGVQVKKPTGGKLLGIQLDRSNVPRITIGPGVRVEGGLHFEREVELHLSDSAVIEGGIEGATPIPFSGAAPAAD